jgi:hypothetical protein
VRPGHLAAFVAALALMLVTAVEWYSTKLGESARRTEQSAPERLTDANVREEAAGVAEEEERNAWQADAGIDRLILVALFVTALLAAWALYFAAAGRRRDGTGLRPSAATGLAALVSALLVLYRTVQEPGFDDLGTVELGPPLALVLAGVVAFASASALRGGDNPVESGEREPGPAQA